MSNTSQYLVHLDLYFFLHNISNAGVEIIVVMFFGTTGRLFLLQHLFKKLSVVNLCTPVCKDFLRIVYHRFTFRELAVNYLVVVRKNYGVCIYHQLSLFLVFILQDLSCHVQKYYNSAILHPKVSISVETFFYCP